MKGPKVVSGVGCGCLLLSLAVLGVSLALPMVTSGRASWGEVSWAIMAGGVLSGLSLLVLLGGVVWLFIARRQS